MSVSEGIDDATKKFKVNNSEDPASNDFSSGSGETLYNNAAAFCIFADTFIHSNHMEGSVAANTLVRNVNEVMEITPRIFPYTYASNYYFYFNEIKAGDVPVSLKKEMIKQSPDEGKPYASLFLGPDLVYAEPEKNAAGVYQINIGGTIIDVPDEYANNGSGRVIYSKSQGKIVAAGDNPTTVAGGGTVKAANKIDFDTVLGKIGGWADKFYDMHDLKLSDATLNGMTYEIQLHDGVNYINITEKQLNDYGFDFKPSASGKCSVVINVVDNGDGIVSLSHDEANKRVSYDGVGEPKATSETLGAASHIMFNFHSSIKSVTIGESTTTELGTILATGAKVIIQSTHDGNVIAKTFENIGVEIHQAAFPFVGKNASSTGKVSIKKIFEHPGDQNLTATFALYQGNYRTSAEIDSAKAIGVQLQKSGNTYTTLNLKEAGPYTIREEKTDANYDGLGATLIHFTLHSDGSVEFDSPKSDDRITKDSSSTDSNLILDVTNSRKKASNPGSVKITKKFTGFKPTDSYSANFKLYSGKYTDINKVDASALVDEKT